MSSHLKNRTKDMVHSSSELCTFLFQYCPDKHQPTWTASIDKSSPIYGAVVWISNLADRMLSLQYSEFPHHSVLPRASCMPATLLVWISLVRSSYPSGFPIEKILKLNSTTSRLEIPEILSSALCYSLSLAITWFTLGHFLFSCFSFFYSPPIFFFSLHSTSSNC